MTDGEVALFAGGTVDRAAHLRGKADELAKDPGARTAVLWRGKALFDGTELPRLAWLPLDAPILADAADAPIFLGLQDGAPRFAHDISAWEDPAADHEQLGKFVDTSENRHPATAPHQSFLDLRANMMHLDPGDAGDVAAAKGIFSWHETHGCCARCGTASVITMAGWQRTCPGCGAHHFPRTDPVVIMLILHRGRVLLGRSPGWPDTMYSLLAGFIEPGESVEEAVRRETVEESGIKVDRVGYITSQPWPFPSSLMIGCWGEASSDKIRIDPEELEDALWVSKQELLDQRIADEPRIRPARHGSIARFILDRWLEGSLGVPAE